MQYQQYLQIGLIAAAAAASGCEGVISDPGAAAGGGGRLDGVDVPLSCAERPAPAPLARLTNLEYRNTVADLFRGVAMPDIALPADNVVEGFDNNATGQTSSPALIEAYRDGARQIARQVVANLTAVLPCSPASAAEERACGEAWIDAFAPRAYRRPLAAEERARVVAFFEDARTQHGFDDAVGMVVQGLLQSPQFLYRVEPGEAPSRGRALLHGYELASRLSYFFWDTAPDDALLAAAESGDLDTAAGVEVEARRLLADPRARAAVANFHRQWLRFDKMDGMRKSTALHPTWNNQVAASLRSSTMRFVDRVFWDMDGSLDALLTDSGAYVNDEIAAIYEVSPPNTSELVWTQTDATRRSGILTQAGLLAGFAHETTDSPVLRGVFVMDRFFCAPPAPPPPGVTNMVNEQAPDGSAPMTTRDRFALMHESGTCAVCHHAIDGFGFGFSHFDAVGGWRETDNGLPVDSSGWISNTRDANGDFDGAVELGQRMAASTQVRDCVTEQWFRYALSVGAHDLDECTVAEIAKSLDGTATDMREILIAAVTSDAFRHRPEVDL